jgi:agmatine deiminase
VKMENVTFRHAYVDSVWMRDFGPWWIQTEDGDREIIDLVYNRPRPNDDKFPSTFAGQERLKAHLTKLILPGGNLILDGKGAAILTDIVFDPSEGGDPNLTVPQLEKYMKELFGVHKVILVKAMKRDGTGHVDMFGKLLNATTMIIGEYATPGDGASNNFAILNENAAKLAKETNGAGEPFKVFRMPMPKYNGRSYTYTNSLIVNDKVLVPTYGFASDAKALDIYSKLMPGAKVVGFDCNQVIGANGAIHCITKLVMSDPLTVAHTPARGEEGTTIAVKATIESEQAIDPAKVQLFWRTAGSAEFTAIPMATDGTTITGEIPAQTAGTQVEYYIRAEDVRGMYETSPEDAGAQNVHGLTVHARTAE